VIKFLYPAWTCLSSRMSLQVELRKNKLETKNKKTCVTFGSYILRGILTTCRGSSGAAWLSLQRYLWLETKLTLAAWHVCPSSEICTHMAHPIHLALNLVSTVLVQLHDKLSIQNGEGIYGEGICRLANVRGLSRYVTYYTGVVHYSHCITIFSVMRLNKTWSNFSCPSCIHDIRVLRKW